MTHGSITTRSERVLKLSDVDTSFNVGPGQYDLPGSIVRAKQSPFPFNQTSPRSVDIVNDIPGPGQYHPEIPKIEIVISAGMKSKSPRKSWDIIDSPSPVDHNFIEDWGKQVQYRPHEPLDSRSPRFTFQGDKKNTTSPADRDIRFPMNRSTAWARSGRRPLYNPDKNPGPGRYDPDSSRSTPRGQSPAFLNNKSREIFHVPDWVSKEAGLGHQDWKLPSKSIAPFGSNARKANFWKSNKNPGPGAYEHDFPRKSSRKGSVGNIAFGTRAERDAAFIGQNPDIPGPGAYKITRKRNIRNNPNAPFSQKSERFVDLKRPYDAEVGKYDLNAYDKIQMSQKQSSQSPQFKISFDRNPFHAANNNVGPGHYSPVFNKSHRLSCRIDDSHRFKEGTFIGFPIPKTPSPGDYEQDVKPLPGRSDLRIRIRHSKRQALGGPTDVPSPDTYHTDYSLFKPSYNVTYSLAKL